MRCARSWASNGGWDPSGVSTASSYFKLTDEFICSRCRELEANQAGRRDPALERAEARGYDLGTHLVDQLADQLEREGIHGRELSVAISGAAEALDQRSDLLLDEEAADPT